MWTTTTIQTARLDFPALVAGDGPPLLCLHGFPDRPETFTALAERLDGWRVVAPFMRGYHPDAIPSEAYFDTGTLAADAAALCEALSPDEAMPVIGHDWGAFATFGLAAAFPHHISTGVTMAVPPPGAGSGLDPAQLKRSFYVWFFQLEGLPEATLGPDFVDFLWETWSPGLQQCPFRKELHETFSDPEIVRCALGYYRALFSEEYQDPALTDVRARAAGEPGVPLLVLGGTDDGAIGAEVIERSRDALPEACKVEIIDGAGHFMQLDQPDAVAERIRSWLA